MKHLRTARTATQSDLKRRMRPWLHYSISQPHGPRLKFVFDCLLPICIRFVALVALNICILPPETHQLSTSCPMKESTCITRVRQYSQMNYKEAEAYVTTIAVSYDCSLSSAQHKLCLEEILKSGTRQRLGQL
jgi:hypothetical protein